MSESEAGTVVMTIAFLPGLMVVIAFIYDSIKTHPKPQRETLASLSEMHQRIHNHMIAQNQMSILKMQNQAAVDAAKYTTEHQCNGCGFWSQLRTCPKCRCVHVEQIKHVTSGSAGVRSWI